MNKSTNSSTYTYLTSMTNDLFSHKQFYNTIRINSVCILCIKFKKNDFRLKNCSANIEGITSFKDVTFMHFVMLQ